MWYLSICAREFALYFSFIAFAQIRRATRPMTAYSGSTPLREKEAKVWCEFINIHSAS